MEKESRIEVGHHPEELEPGRENKKLRIRRRVMTMLLEKQGNNHQGEGYTLFFWGPSSFSQNIPVLD